MTADELTQKAIDSALSNNWSEAINLNLLLLNEDSNDINTLNRLTHAYLESGKITESKKTCQKVLNLDRYNSIASKNMSRICANPRINKKCSTSVIQPINFLEEPGKTKIVALNKLATPKELSLLTAGGKLKLVAKKHRIDVVGEEDQYLGVLPDDISYHLLNLIKTGNEYDVFVTSIKPTSLTIFIREVCRSKRNLNRPSFPLGDHLSHPLVLSKKEDLKPQFSDEEADDFEENSDSD